MDEIGKHLEREVTRINEEHRKIDNEINAQNKKNRKEYDSQKAYVDRIEINERNCRNIISKNSNGYDYINAFGWPNAADYRKVGGSYFHTFFHLEENNAWVIYECMHGSYDSFQNHVYWITEGRTAYDKLMSMKEPEEVINDGSGEITLLGVMYDEFEDKIKRAYIPLKDIIRERQAAVLNSLLPKIKSFECTDKVYEIGKKCKSLNQCQLYVKDEQLNEIGISCRCGHSLRLHKFKIKNKSETDAVLTQIYKYES